MLTVAILINGQPIMARSAVNRGRTREGKTEYRVDDGSIIGKSRGNPPFQGWEESRSG